MDLKERKKEEAHKLFYNLNKIQSYLFVTEECKKLKLFQ